MAKKINVSRIPTPSVDLAAFQPTGELPTTEQANKNVEALTGQKALKEEIKQMTKKLEMADRATGRPKKEAAKDRVKFTTSLRSDLVKWLKLQAIEQGVTPADILEKAIMRYKSTG